MAFTIPNVAAVPYDAVQARVYQCDLDALAAGRRGTGVEWGGAASAQSTPTWVVSLTGCGYQIDGRPVRMVAQNVTVSAAHSTLYRIDLIVANQLGVPSVVAGTAAAAATVQAPAIPALSVLLHRVDLKPAAASVANTQITDKRVMLETPTVEQQPSAKVLDVGWDSEFTTAAAETPYFGMDYQRCVKLPDGRTLWIVQDAFVDHSGAGSTLIHNMGAIQTGTSFVQLRTGTAAAPTSWVGHTLEDPFDRWFWPMDGYLLNSTTIVWYFCEFTEPAGTYLSDADPVATWIAEINIPTAPAAPTVTSFVLAAPTSGVDFWGWAIAEDDTYRYLYGHSHHQFDGGTGHNASTRLVKASRHLKSQDSRSATHTYWDGAAWTTTMANAVNIAPLIARDGGERVQNPMAITRWDGRWIATSKRNDWFGTQIDLDTSDDGVHWRPASQIAEWLLAFNDADKNSYFANFAPRESGEDDPVIGLSHNTFAAGGDPYPYYRSTWNTVPLADWSDPVDGSFDAAAYDPLKWWTGPPGRALEVLLGPHVSLFLDASNYSGTTLTNLGTAGATLNGTTTGTPTVVTESDGRKVLSLDGTDDYINVPDDALLDTASAVSLSVVAAIQDDSGTGTRTYVSKRDTATTGTGWTIGTVTGVLTSPVHDGTVTLTPNAIRYPVGTRCSVALVKQAGLGDLAYHGVNGTFSQPTAKVGTGSIANALPLRVGRNAGASATVYAFKFAGLCFYKNVDVPAQVMTTQEAFDVGNALRDGSDTYRAGDRFTVTTAGTFQNLSLVPGDVLVARTTGKMTDPIWIVEPTAGTASAGLNVEAARDLMAETLVPGANMTITVNDPGNIITLAPSQPAGTKTSALGTQTGATLATGDLFTIVDVDNLTMAASGTNEKITFAELLVALRRQGTPITKRVTTQWTNSTVTPSNVTDMAFTLEAGREYHFLFYLPYQTAATTTGIGFNLTGPAITRVTWHVEIHGFAAAGSGPYVDRAVALATNLMSTGVIAATTNYPAIIEGIIEPSAGGTLQLQGRSEVAASAVTIPLGGIGILTDTTST